MATAKTIALTESVQQMPGKLSVDRSTRTIHNAKFLGYESLNKHGISDVDGTEYLREGVKAALPLYEGKQVYLDHPEGRNANAERRIRDLAGRLHNPRDEADGGYGDIRCNTTPAGELLLGLAESDPGSFGMSHNAAGKSRVDRKRRKNVVESIPKVNSVDAVTSPATTINLGESQEPNVKTLKAFIEQFKLDKIDGLTKLLEDEGMAMDAAPASDGGWRSHLANAITAVVQDGELDEAGVKAKVMAILKALKEEEKAPEKPAETETKTEESVELVTLRAEKGVRTLCESLQFPPTEKQVAALAKLTEAQQRDMIGDLKGTKSAPRSNSGRPLIESRDETPTDPKLLAAWLKN